MAENPLENSDEEVAAYKTGRIDADLQLLFRRHHSRESRQERGWPSEAIYTHRRAPYALTRKSIKP